MIQRSQGAGCSIRSICRYVLAAYAFACGSAHAADSYQLRLQDWLTAQGYGSRLQVVQVNIFGDGEATNGIEDSRIDMSSPLWNERERRPWNMSAGTVHCDGRNRGSAVIMDTRSLGKLPRGFIVASSAHVLFDLDSNQAFKRCQFHYMALDKLPGYQAEIDLKHSRIGRFDPASRRENPAFGQDDWAFLYVAAEVPGVNITGRIKPRSFDSVLKLPGFDGQVQFIAFNPDTGSINISTQCVAQESLAGDLGGGAWKGQLLDDCDSEGGASGGGLIAHVEGESFLVGIRSGAHWDGGLFPALQFPAGPPQGSLWDIRTNTNFSRAIDPQLLSELRSLIRDLDSSVALKEQDL